MGIMYKARRYLSQKSIVNLYYSYIYPYLIYGIESWGNAAHCHPDPIFKLQKKILFELLPFLIIMHTLVLYSID